MHSFVFW